MIGVFANAADASTVRRKQTFSNNNLTNCSKMKRCIVCQMPKLGNRSNEAMKRCDEVMKRCGEAFNASSLQFLCQR
jgi:hypothetical protein